MPTLTPVSFDPFATKAPTLTPVAFDPFAQTQTPAMVETKPTKPPPSTSDALLMRARAGVGGMIGGAQQSIAEGMGGLVNTPMALVNDLLGTQGRSISNPLGEGLQGVAAEGAGISEQARLESQDAQQGITAPTGVMDALGNPVNAAKYYGGILAESTPAILGAMATRNPAAATGLMGATSAAQTYGQERAEGATPLQALDRGVQSGMMEAALGKAPFETAMGVGSLPKRAVKAGLQEAGTEAVTGGGQKIASDADKGIDTATSEINRVMADSAIVGTAMGPVEAVLGSPSVADAILTDAPPAAKAGASQAADALAQARARRKTAPTVSPDVDAEIDALLTKGSGDGRVAPVAASDPAVAMGRVGDVRAEPPVADPGARPDGNAAASLAPLAEEVAHARLTPVLGDPFSAGTPVPDTAVANDPPEGAALRGRWRQDFGSVEREYASQIGEFDSEGGRVLNTDIARELSPEYRADRSKSAAVHEAASDFVKQLYAKKLSQPTPAGRDPVVVISAGGTGAGKTTGLRGVGDAIGNPEIVYDTNANSFESTATKIDQALAAGRSVAMVYTYRDPVDALVNGALPRAMRMAAEQGTGRTVPVQEHAKTHAGSANAIRQLAAHYTNDPRVSFSFIDNSRGKNAATLVPIEKLPAVEENGLNERLQAALESEHAAGRISDAVYAGFAGHEAVGRPLRAGRREEPQQPVVREEGLTPAEEPAAPRESREPSSWVIRNKETGDVVLETFDRKKVEALNTAKYEAVPIREHLESLNAPRAPGERWGDRDRPAPRKSEVVQPQTPAPAGVSASRLKRSAQQQFSGYANAPNVEVWNSPADMPEGKSKLTALDSEDDGHAVEGMYEPETNTVHFFADRLPSPKRQRWVAAHEIVGHAGVRGYVEKVGRGSGSLKRMLTQTRTHPTIDALTKAVAGDRDLDGNLDLATEEAIAELSAAEMTGDWDHIADRYGVTVPARMRPGIKAAILRYVDAVKRLFGLIDPTTESFTDADWRTLVNGARRYVREKAKGGAVKSGGDPLLQTAYHGTPHTVDKFSLDKIGTGEGNQAYGHGLYFASNKEVSEYYRGGIGKATEKTAAAKPAAIAALERNAMLGFENASEALRAIRTSPNFAKQWEIDSPADVAALDAYRKTFGNLYEVEVPEDSDLLDWDKLLSEQPPKVQAALAPLLNATRENALDAGEARGPFADLGATAVAAFRRGDVKTGADVIRYVGNSPEGSRFLLSLGIPGLRYLDGISRGAGDGSYNYVIWDEGAIRDTKPLLSVAPRTPAQKDALTKAGLPVDERTTLARLKDKISEQWNELRELAKGNVKQRVFDRFHRMSAIEAELGVTPENSAYLSARLAQGLPSIMEGVMLYGAPEWQGGVLGQKANTVGLLDALKPVEGDIDGWLGWMVGRRAQALKAQGRENLMTDVDIHALLSLAQGKEAQFKQAAAAYLKMKDAVLDVAEKAGLIDGASRATWDSVEYIPFYRADDSDTTLGPGTQKSLTNQSSGIKQLKGGTQNLADPLGNIIRNFTKLIDASLKNNAVLEAVDQYGPTFFEKVGMGGGFERIPLSEIKKALLDRGVPQTTIDNMPQGALTGLQKMWAVKPPSDPDVVRVMRDGRPEYYRVPDPDLLQSLTSFKVPTKHWAIKPFIFTKRLLTAGVTASPEFMARNFIRDSGSAWVISDDRFRFGWDSVAGVIKPLLDDTNKRTVMFAGGSFIGGQIHGGSPDETAAALRRALRAKGLTSKQIEDHLLTLARTPLDVWDRWQKIGSALENANRTAVYEAAIKAGRSPKEAAYMARDLMDFSMQGDSRIVQALADVLPFFNARLQGLYKLYRQGGKKALRKALLVRAGTITAATFGLLAWNLAMYGDAYDELEEWDKDTYWHIAPGTEFHIRIPKPFELGVLFATVPERIGMALIGKDRLDQTAKSMMAQVSGTLAMNPVPQALMPLLELWANKSAFTGRPIENQGDQQVLPEARAEWYTSDTAKAVSDWIGNATNLSPKRIEHLWNGYTGTVGAYALETVDWLVRQVEGTPERPELAWAEMPLVKALYRGDLTPKSTRYTTEFYDLLDKANEVSGTIKEFELAGKTDAAAELEQKWAWLLGDREESKRAKAGFMHTGVRAFNKARDRMSDIRKEIEGIVAMPGYTDAQKRELIDALAVERNALAREITTTYQARR